VVLLEKTVPICSPTILGADRPLGCIRRWQVQGFANKPPLPSPPMFSEWLSLPRRALLAGAFWSRNEQSHTLPVASVRDVIWFAPSDVARVVGGESNHTAGIAGFSAPAYSGDGYALLFAKYRCGELCEYSWFLLLERQGEQWQVLSQKMVGVS